MTSQIARLREAAGMPPYAETQRLVLEKLRTMEMPVTRAQVGMAVATHLDLTAEQRSVIAPDGRTSVVDWEVAWALSAFKRTGFVVQPRYRWWTLTDEGRRLSLEDHNRRDRARQRQRRDQKITDAPSELASPDAADEPDSVLDWQQELLDVMKVMTPSAFELLAGELLLTAGFDDVKVTGRSGDGGIDGIGTYRPAGLVSFRTAFQCKRYAGSVGPGAVRDFRGSFVGQADRGIIITTGSFTATAMEEAVRAGAPTVDLIDGEELCELLKQHQIGVDVRTRTVEDITVNEGYFEWLEEAAR